MTTSEGIIRQARAEGRVLLTEIESKDLLKNAGIRVVDTRLATTREEAVSLAGQIGFPVVLKVVSPAITHKTDAGGVKLNLQNADQVGQAYEAIIASARQYDPQAVILGVAVQPMSPPGTEVIMGMSRDPQFGPVLMFGLGGILVEVLKDVSFRIVPLSQGDSREMIREIKGYPLLTGYRGQPPAAIAKLEEMLLRISALVEAVPELQELDLNPVFAYADDVVAVDARVILTQGS